MARPRPKRPKPEPRMHPAQRARLERKFIRHVSVLARRYNQKRVDAGLEPTPFEFLGDRLT